MDSQSRHPIISRIYSEVSHLSVPTLGSLQSLWHERMDEHKQRLRDLELQQQEIRERGFNAAIRLMTAGLPSTRNEPRSYFEQINNRRGD